ncbi:MAG: DUF2608 domain-containing protein [Kangiellaceae bacterium]|nr:DUF2608 domain-containing protein [Kangiellaceae bacterium]MCW8997139.1 DUF2608 domain-containing protein [Kangiellaceae bacterium]MCW9018397.1 DUF2608 domain-containing protein [Kangiellaceae bacterium]
MRMYAGEQLMLENTMQKILFFLAILLLNVTIINDNVEAKANLSKVKSFKELHKIVNQLGSEQLAHTLVVMDDDDTLTMMSCPHQKKEKTCQYLGGPAWYSWQQDLLNSQSKYKVADNSQELLDIAALLLAMNNMVYTEKRIPHILGQLTQSGVKLLVLTARGSSNLSATTSQFSKLAVKELSVKQSTTTDESFLDLINSNALKGKKSQIASIASPFQPADCNASRPLSYQQGVMYVAGQNKGEMLQCLLARTDSGKIKNIVFIDDTLANVKDVYQAFKDKQHYQVTALHYTALQKHKAALTEGDKANTLQQNAQNRWRAIKSTLQSELLKPAFN